MNTSELLTYLHKAEKLLSKYQGGYSEEFMSAEEFREALLITIKKLELGSDKELNALWRWFAPTSVWDDFVGEKGIKLGDKIFELVDYELKK